MKMKLKNKNNPTPKLLKHDLGETFQFMAAGRSPETLNQPGANKHGPQEPSGVPLFSH